VDIIGIGCSITIEGPRGIPLSKESPSRDPNWQRQFLIFFPLFSFVVATRLYLLP